MDRRHALALLEDPTTAVEGLAWFAQRVAALPDSVRAAFDLACAHEALDHTGATAEACERALRLGLDQLPEADQARWHVRYGSALRILGRLEESRAVLEGGRALFPDDGALPVFLAFTELAAGNRDAALAVLLAGAAAADPYGSRAGFRRGIEAGAAQFGPR